MTMDIVKRSVLALAVALAAAFLAVATAQSSVAELRAAVQATPEDAEAWTRLGNAAFEAGELEDAKDAYLEAIALDYLLGDAHYGLGLVEFARGDFQGALFAFNEVTRLFPDRFDGHYNRAVTLATLRRPAMPRPRSAPPSTRPSPRPPGRTASTHTSAWPASWSAARRTAKPPTRSVKRWCSLPTTPTSPTTAARRSSPPARASRRWPSSPRSSRVPAITASAS
jgi:tetratricopeptide (TPR) repeat protein